MALDPTPDPTALVDPLLKWYHTHKRELPWRTDPTPYRVWVSEIMLQQTQVATVIPYFERWMETFPTLADLAAAEQEQVLQLWSGLGYYRRARMLHRAAQELVAAGQLTLPDTVPELLKISGIGRYTAGAIASIAFNRPAPIVDGNVIRVFCRLFAIAGDPRSTDNQKRLWALAQEMVPEEEPGAFNQALMELGATVCTPKKPACLLCPVQGHCQALAQGRVSMLPEARKRTQQRPMYLATALLYQNDHTHYLLRQRPSEGLFGGLWEFINTEVPAQGTRKPHVRAMQRALEEHLAELKLNGRVVGRGEVVNHMLSHIKMTVQPFFVVCDEELDRAQVGDRPGRWISSASLPEQALSSVSHKLIAQLPKEP
ncbi:MAG: A/G-specific adenine glycosylase [Myxococcota bacterium]